MRKRLLYIAALVICLSIITGGTLAYFTADDTAHNVITTNTVKIDVLSQQKSKGSLEDDGNAPIRIMPGTTVSRVVSAQSIEATAWVRMYYELLVYDAEGKQMTVSEDKLKQMIIIEPDERYWTEKDGWWYCNSKVETGKTTAPLFDSIEFSGPNMGNEYQSGTVELVIHAQAVQYANNPGPATEVAGWPRD